jgi:hypothetical protein
MYWFIVCACSFYGFTVPNIVLHSGFVIQSCLIISRWTLYHRTHLQVIFLILVIFIPCLAMPLMVAQIYVHHLHNAPLFCANTRFSTKETLGFLFILFGVSFCIIFLTWFWNIFFFAAHVTVISKSVSAHLYLAQSARSSKCVESLRGFRCDFHGINSMCKRDAQAILPARLDTHLVCKMCALPCEGRDIKLPGVAFGCKASDLDPPRYVKIFFPGSIILGNACAVTEENEPSRVKESKPSCTQETPPKDKVRGSLSRKTSSSSSICLLAHCMTPSIVSWNGKRFFALFR